MTRGVRQREQAPRTPYASRGLVAVSPSGGLALVILLDGSEMQARAQIFDPTNAAPTTAGTLDVDHKSL